MRDIESTLRIFLGPWIKQGSFMSQESFFLKLRVPKLVTCNKESPDRYTQSFLKQILCSLTFLLPYLTCSISRS